MWPIGWLIARLRRSSTYLESTPRAVVGRDEFCRRLVRAACDNGCVLLFGGRQSGKSSILRRTVETLSSAQEDEGVLNLPVVLDLMRLRHDADPEQFFRFAAGEVSACARTRGLRARYPVGRSRDLVGFEKVIKA